MNRKDFRLAICVFALLVVVAFASSASAEWNEKVLYSFQGLPDGATPVGSVVFDQRGNLYGATQNGGASSCPSIEQCGTVYQLAPPAKTGDPWTETVLYVFKGNPSGDGTSPYGGLVIDSAGNLFGTTGYGGTGDCVLLGYKRGCGTVFELSPPKQKGGAWTETVLYSFPSAKQGYLPWGDLVFDSAGNLYGATMFGGGFGTCDQNIYLYCGTVFKLSPPTTKGGKWTETVLHGFKGVAEGAQFGDGANPNGGLALDNKGEIFGTTYFGGNNQKGRCQGGVGGTGCGIVFELIPPSQKDGKWTEKLVHRFNGEDGSNSAAGLVFDAKGQLYGATSGGGGREGGVVFVLAPPTNGGGWTEAVIHTFVVNGQKGCCVAAGLSVDANGDLYGTTYSGGTFSGSVFRLKPPSRSGGDWSFNTLYGFAGSPDGAQPAANLIFDRHGSLYSTTQKGGTGPCSFYGCGTVFKLLP
jgi:hypothetical protein